MVVSNTKLQFMQKFRR